MGKANSPGLESRYSYSRVYTRYSFSGIERTCSTSRFLIYLHKLTLGFLFYGDKVTILYIVSKIQSSVVMVSTKRITW